MYSKACPDLFRGINTLTGADAVAPFAGAAFHDNKVWIRPPGLIAAGRLRVSQPSLRSSE